MTDGPTVKGTVAWLAWQADHAREQGTMVVLTPDEADAIVRDAVYDDDEAGGRDDHER